MTEVFAKQALLPQGWRRNVQITIAADGTFTSVTPDSTPGPDMQLLDMVVPPQISLHSHAFQRAMAGLAERRQNPDDTFWTWRTRMYQLAHRISPEQMQDVAAFLYMQMLKAGYAQVAEFHYLHNAVDGRPYASLAEMSSRLAAAATDAGIGITLLPTLYARGGFDGSPLNDAQKRFASTPDTIARILSDLQSDWHGSPLVTAGVGLHSLRAVDIHTLGDLLRAAGPAAPIHIHIAEQQREVETCLSVTGQRPVEHLMSHLPVDARWCLVHATHLSAAEVTAIARSEAVAGLCPITEANLGDGIFPFEAYVAQSGRFGIGSDSNVLLSPWEELRLLEYGLRLQSQKRCVALPPDHKGSIGAWLYRQSLAGSAQASGLPLSGLQPGARADLCVLDEQALSLPDLQNDDILDSAIFATSSPPVRHVMCAGQWRITDGHHPDEARLTRAFHATLRTLMAA
ncbi:formimidoylglutamate deiminase [Gluconobacter albidus]|uniref:formimidoylglutamate deiminase n=1 Tax=Gluconobacter albidus TaxID=318683 RepID=UPI001B8C2B16|nr:formimidoylglutamate deiminase [Gluconobacter albidus]MBS1027074.1 formimidoylglutamate deiminase [Gluconobacter albidus]